ncbi:MAG: DUF6307 family protein [Actinomycetota bacterium]|nr:DUF6307 family protein [Actinomycetota bacterium]
MNTVSPTMSLYEQRVTLVQNVITDQTKLKDKAAYELAVHILAAFEEIPASVR